MVFVDRVRSHIHLGNDHNNNVIMTSRSTSLNHVHVHRLNDDWRTATPDRGHYGTTRDLRILVVACSPPQPPENPIAGPTGTPSDPAADSRSRKQPPRYNFVDHPSVPIFFYARFHCKTLRGRALRGLGYGPHTDRSDVSSRPAYLPGPPVS